MALREKVRDAATKYLALETPIRVLLTTSVIRNLGTSLWEPLLGLYITGTLAVPLIMFGLMTTIRQFVQTLTSLPAGFLSDTFSRKKMIAFSLACSILALLTLSVSQSLPQLFLISIFQGLSLAFMGPSKSAYVIEVTPDERRGVAFSTIALFESLSNIIAIFLAGILVNSVGFPVLFGTALVLQCLSLIGTILYLREPAVRGSATTHTPRTALTTQLKQDLAILKYPPLLAVLLGIVFHQLGLGIEGPYLTIYARDVLLFSLPSISLMLGLQRLGIFAGQFPSGRIVDKYGGEISFAFHIFVTTPVMVLFMRTGNPFMASAILFLWGLTFGLDNVSRQKLVAKYRSGSGIATAFGVIGLVSGCVSLVTPTVGAWVWTNFSPQSVFYAAAAANVVGAVSLFILWLSKKA